MKKILLALLVIIIIAGAGGAYFVINKLDSIIAQTIEKEGSAALNTRVSVSQVTTQLKDGKASIAGITIANPSGYTNQNALSLNSISAEVDYKQQIIKLISINQPIINAELKGSSSNFQDLLDGIPESSNQESEQSGSSDQKITINKLQLTKATVNLLATDYAPAAKYGLDNDLDLDTSFVMDDFVMTNITGTVDEVTDEISTKLMNHVSSQVKAYVTDLVKEEAKKQIKEKATEKIKDALGDKLKGLF